MPTQPLHHAADLPAFIPVVSERPLNIAHRGARSLAPENTLAAARRARAVGADMWELDVSVTADGQLVLFHDDSLARTTNAQEVFPDRAPWTITTFTLAELRTLDGGGWFVDTDPMGEIANGALTPSELAAYRGERIPTLWEALEFTRDNDWHVNVEIKRLPPPQDAFPVVEKVAALIADLDIVDRVVVSSFVHERLWEVRRLLPEVRVHGLLGFQEDEQVDLRLARPFDGLNPRYNLVSDEQILAALAAGYRVVPWVVNEVRDMERFIALGVSGIITDYPQRLAALLDRRVAETGT